MQEHVLEVAKYCNPLPWAIALFITFISISILVCYWNNRTNAATGQTDRHKSTAISTEGEGLNEMTVLYCPKGCQGACACPKLDSWALDPRASSPQANLLQRVHFLLGKILIYPEYLRQMFEDDEGLVDIVEGKLDALLKEHEKEALSSSSSLICRVASRELNEAPFRRIRAGLAMNYESLRDTTYMDTNWEYRHVRKRKFRKLMRSGQDGKCRERCGTI